MRLIDADVAIRTLENGRYSTDYCKEHGIDYSISMEMVRILLDNLPSVQPERKTGQWISSDSELEIKCNKCGKDFGEYVDSPDYIYLVERPKFCPNCGTDMRGDKCEIN